jgi:hypothetical protein
MAGLQEFAENIWIIDGPLVHDMGIPFTTRMTVVKLSEGSVWVESPVPVSYTTLNQITVLGPIRYLVAATPRHVWRLESWHTLFPDAQLWIAPQTLFTLGSKQLSLTNALGEKAPESWAKDLEQLPFKGNSLLSEVLFLHKASHTVILGDLIQSHSLGKNTLTNALLRLEGAVSTQGVVGLDIRLTFTNKKLARQSLEKLLSWDFDKLIIAHGPCINKGARILVEKAFSWLIH